jgi:hypothetical protein
MTKSICIDNSAFILKPVMEGGVWSGAGVITDGTDFYFDPETAGPGPHVVTYTLGSATWHNTIIVVPLPAVSFAPSTFSVAYTVPFPIIGGSPGGGAYYIGGMGSPITVFDVNVFGKGVFQIYYVVTNREGCAAQAMQTLTVT